MTKITSLYLYLATQMGLNPVLAQPMNGKERVVVSGIVFDPLNMVYFKKILYWAYVSNIQFELQAIYAESYNCQKEFIGNSHTIDFVNNIDNLTPDNAFLGLFESIALASGWTYKEAA